MRIAQLPNLLLAISVKTNLCLFYNQFPDQLSATQITVDRCRRVSVLNLKIVATDPRDT